MPFCFMMKKNHFKQKLLLWAQISFNQSFLPDSIHGTQRLTRNLSILNEGPNPQCQTHQSSAGISFKGLSSINFKNLWVSWLWQKSSISRPYPRETKKVHIRNSSPFMLIISGCFFIVSWKHCAINLGYISLSAMLIKI